MRKLIDKPGEDASKLPRAEQEHETAREVFEFMNQQFLDELPRLLDLRIPFFDPSFEAMIRMQCKFAEEGYEKLGGVQRSVDHACVSYPLLIVHDDAGISLTMCEMTMLRDNLTPRYDPSDFVTIG